MTGSGSGTGGPPSRPRLIAFRVSAFLFGAGALGGLFGIGLVIGWYDADEGGIHRIHDIGFGVLYGVVVATAFFVLTLRPAGKPSVFLQVVATALAVAIAAMVSADLAYLSIAAALAVTSAILLALHPARDEVLHPRTNLSRPIAAFVLAAAVPLTWFGLTAGALQRDGSPLDPHVSMSHWTTMAAAMFGLVAIGLLASLRIPGWRVTAWCAGLGAAVYGLSSTLFNRFPGSHVPYPGSEGVAWGLVALIGGIAFVAVAEWEARRTDDQRPPIADPSGSLAPGSTPMSR